MEIKNASLGLMGKIRIGAVSYLNTKPMITGLEKVAEIELIVDYPAKIAEMLLKDEIDIGLVPVAIIPQLNEHYIISDYGIACEGAVASVCLFSDVPIEEIKTVILDYQSKTSVQLLKILLTEYWKREVNFIDAKEAFQDQIKDTTAGLVIGDRAFALAKQKKYSYDLGETWKAHTGLAFVFATWVSNKKLDSLFTEQFNKTIQQNMENYFEHLDEFGLEDYEKSYLKNNIKFTITSDYKKGLNVFLQKLL
jgi:chorismate dehydratase